MNEIKSKLIIPIPPRHIVEKFNWAFIEVSKPQLLLIGGLAMLTMVLLGAGKALGFPFGYAGYLFLIAAAYGYKRFAWTHDKYMETKAMLEYHWYKRKGLMDISYTDTYERIKTLFPYEIKNIKDGIIYFGSGKYGVIISVKPRKMTPEEITEYSPVLEQLIDSLPKEIILKVRARTTIVSGNILEKMVLQQLQSAKSKQEKALLFSLYDKSKEHESSQKWSHTLFCGIQSTDDQVETYLQTILPGITNMLQSSKVLCTHVIDPIKILSQYSGDFTMHESHNENQGVLLLPKGSKLAEPLSQMIHGGARFEQKHIIFDGTDYACPILVGMPENLGGGWPDNLDTQVLPRIYALSDSKKHTIEINVTELPIDNGDAIDQIKAVIQTIDINKAGNQTNSNLRVLTHSENKYAAILERLQDGTIRLNEVSYIITVKAKNIEDMRAGVSKIRAILNANSIKSKIAKGNIRDIFKSTRFFPIYYENISTCMPTVALGKVLPLMNGSENTSSDHPDKYSLYMADDIRTHHEYVFNLGEMGACHAIIVGPTRSGKTTFLAIIGARAISAGFRVIYITVKPDETTNYLNVAKHFEDKGEVIFLGRGKKNINPLEILHDSSTIFDPKQTFFQHITIVKQFINMLCATRNTGDELNSLQLAYVERKLIQLYSMFGITSTDTATWKQEKQPTLIDLYRIFDHEKEGEGREAVQAGVLESRLTSLTHNWDFLSEKTSISLDRDYIVIDLSGLPADLIPSMNYFMTAIIGLRFRADVQRKNIIMIDEGRAFLKTGLGEDIIKIATQGGSQGVAVWFATQQPQDMIDISAEMLNNSFIRLAFGNNMEIEPVAKAFRLPTSDQDFLRSCTKPGQVLIQMKSPFNQTYHCELNLSELEKQILFGENEDASATFAGFKFLSNKLAAFSKERGIICADWIQNNNESVKLKANMGKEFVVRTVGSGKVWVYASKGLIDEQGLIKNQTPDHYYSTAQICGWAIDQGLDVHVNDYDDADTVITLPDKSTIAIEYQTSLPGNNTPEKIMSKWKSNTTKYGRLLFVSDSVGVKEIRSIINQDDIVIPRGTKLEEYLLSLMGTNPNQN